VLVGKLIDRSVQLTRIAKIKLQIMVLVKVNALMILAQVVPVD
jgi:hypothetical protein